MTIVASDDVTWWKLYAIFAWRKLRALQTSHGIKLYRLQMFFVKCCFFNSVTIFSFNDTKISPPDMMKNTVVSNSRPRRFKFTFPGLIINGVCFLHHINDTLCLVLQTMTRFRLLLKVNLINGWEGKVWTKLKRKSLQCPV